MLFFLLRLAVTDCGFFESANPIAARANVSEQFSVARMKAAFLSSLGKKAENFTEVLQAVTN